MDDYEIDDSAIIHGRSYYDPVKAREYYLRTRKLKGRKSGSKLTSTGPRIRRAPDSNSGQNGGGTSDSVLRGSRKESLQIQKKRLEKRLARLKELLKAAVDKALEPEASKEEAADETGKSDRAKSSDLTEAEKAEKRKDSKERYEKENKTSLSQEVDDLRQQVKETRTKLQEALAEAKQSEQKKREDLKLRSDDPKKLVEHKIKKSGR